MESYTMGPRMSHKEDATEGRNLFKMSLFPKGSSPSFSCKGGGQGGGLLWGWKSFVR